MEKKMETTIVYWGKIGIILGFAVFWDLYWDPPIKKKVFPCKAFYFGCTLAPGPSLDGLGLLPYSGF